MSLELNYLIFYHGGSLLKDINQRTKRKDYCAIISMKMQMKQKHLLTKKLLRLQPCSNQRTWKPQERALSSCSFTDEKLTGHWPVAGQKAHNKAPTGNHTPGFLTPPPAFSPSPCLQCALLQQNRFSNPNLKIQNLQCSKILNLVSIDHVTTMEKSSLDLTYITARTQAYISGRCGTGS